MDTLSLPLHDGGRIPAVGLGTYLSKKHQVRDAVSASPRSAFARREALTVLAD
jgi:hypothetical protein